jgi:hypothetical protein
MKRDGRLYYSTDVDIHFHRKWLQIRNTLNDAKEYAVTFAAFQFLCAHAKRHHPDGVFSHESEMLSALHGLDRQYLEVLRAHGVLDGNAIHNFEEWNKTWTREVANHDRAERRYRASDVRTNGAKNPDIIATATSISNSVDLNRSSNSSDVRTNGHQTTDDRVPDNVPDNVPDRFAKLTRKYGGYERLRSIGMDLSDPVYLDWPDNAVESRIVEQISDAELSRYAARSL